MSFAKLISDLDGTHKQLKDVRLHQFSGSKAGSLQGEIYEDVTRDAPQFVATGDAHLDILCSTATPPPTLSVGQVPEVGASVRGLRSDAKFGLPGVATGAASGFMSATDKAKLDAATTTPTADALAKYDANGRLIVADAVSGQHAVNWQTMQTQISLNQQGLAEKGPCRALFTTLPANTYNGTTKRITASANGALPASDGVSSWQVNDRVFFCGVIGTGSAQAGPYKIVQVGSGSLPFILERSPDFGGPGAPAVQRLVGAKVQVLEGTDHGDTFWVCTNDSVTLDTTVLVFRKQTAADVDNSTIELDAAGNIRIKDKGVSYAKIQDSAALSVPGRASNTSGVLADIASTADGQVLRRSGTSLGFGVVANAGLADMAQSTIKGRASGTGTGVPTDLSAAQVRTILNVADGANAYVHPNHSGDVVSVADGATTIQPGVVTNAKLANMATSTIKGRVTAGAGSPEDLTPAQAWAMISLGTGAENLNLPLKVATGTGWFRVCTLRTTTDTHYSTAVIDIASMGRNAAAADHEVARIYARLKQNGTGKVISVQYTQQGSSSWTVGYSLALDDPTEKILHVYVYFPSSTEFACYSVVASHANALANTPVFYQNPSAEGTQPTGWGGATPADTVVGNIKVTGLAGSGIRPLAVQADGAIISGNSLTYKATIGNGSASSFTLAHGLGTADLQVSAIEVATGEPVGVSMTIDATNIVVTPGVVLPSNSLRILAQKV